MTDKVLARVPPAAAPQARQSNEVAAAAAARPLAPLAGADDDESLAATSCPDSARRRRRCIAARGADVAETAPAEPVAAAATAPPAPSRLPTSGRLRRRRPRRRRAATAPPAHNADRRLLDGASARARRLAHRHRSRPRRPRSRRARARASPRRSSCSTSRCASRSCSQKVPGVEVILTRRTDEFIPLPERTAIANREGADLFLSIHANASTNAQAHGIETYFLNFANNLSAAAVAARENAASAQAMGALPDFVKAIALNNKLDESRDFAHARAARDGRAAADGRTRRCKDLGVKQAPFVVLIGAAMPSVLAEISFVTNAQEAKLLKGERLPPADRRGAVQRDPEVPDVAEERRRRSRCSRQRCGAEPLSRESQNVSCSLRPTADCVDRLRSAAAIGSRTSRRPSPRRAARAASAIDAGQPERSEQHVGEPAESSLFGVGLDDLDDDRRRWRLATEPAPASSQS